MFVSAVPIFEGNLVRGKVGLTVWCEIAIVVACLPSLRLFITKPGASTSGNGGSRKVTTRGYQGALRLEPLEPVERERLG